MHPLLAVVGAALVLTALVDMLWTTVAVSAGGGPLTSKVADALWSGMRRLGRRSSSHRVLQAAGVTVVIAVFTTWLLLFVVGWWLVFSSSAGAVVDATTTQPVGWLARLYYVGFTASTLGIGDVVAGEGLWRVLTILAAFTGLGVVTMSITYLVPVAGAVVDRRTFALAVSALGERAEQVVVNAWQGGDWWTLEARLQQLDQQLATLGQRHLAYPVLHYFHDVERAAAAPVSLAVLDDALTLLRFGLAPDARPHGLVVDPVRTTVASFLATLQTGHIGAASEPPPAPDLRPLRDAGIPTVTDEEFRRAVDDLSERRALIRGFLHDDGWRWDLDEPIHGDDQGSDSDAGASPRDVEATEGAA